MKKIFTLAAIAVASLTATAQTTVAGSKLFDNWSIGVSGGVITPTTGYGFISSMRPVVGLEVAKQITPVFGMAAELHAAINSKCGGVMRSQGSATIFDASNVSLLGQVNLMNLFGGYKGSPKFFEAVAVGGIGWGHYYYAGGDDDNTWTSKFGLDLNFNVCEALQINVKPAIVYDLEGGDKGGSFNKFNLNNSSIELMAGVTYKFKNSNGSHNFTLAKLYDQAEVDGLNAKVNDLRSQVAAKDAQLTNDKTTISSLQKQLNDCRNAGPKTVTKSTNSLESTITFAQGKSIIATSQLPNVERIATYLKNHKESKVVIKGYASPEGSAEINAKIATARAEAVKTMLINKYNISASRIEAEGQGVGDMFSEADWNRVSICTIDESK